MAAKPKKTRPRYGGSVDDLAAVVAPYCTSMTWLSYPETRNTKINVATIMQHKDPCM